MWECVNHSELDHLIPGDSRVRDITVGDYFVGLCHKKINISMLLWFWMVTELWSLEMLKKLLKCMELNSIKTNYPTNLMSTFNFMELPLLNLY